MMTRNERRAQNRRLARLSESRIESAPAPAVSREPQVQTSRKIHRSDIPGLMAHDTPRRHKPRNTWHQPGWSGISPFYWNLTTIDGRWDK